MAHVRNADPKEHVFLNAMNGISIVVMGPAGLPNVVESTPNVVNVRSAIQET